MSTEGGLLTEAKPNLAHYAIAELHNLGKLDCVITQNIDNLHQKAGVPEDRVFELHGNMEWAVCLSCHRRFPMPEVLRRMEQGVEVPDCPECRGILKPDAVFFGEALPQETLQEAIRRARNCDLLVVIGQGIQGVSQFGLDLFLAAQEMDLLQEEDVAPLTVSLLERLNPAGLERRNHLIGEILSGYVEDAGFGMLLENGVPDGLAKMGLAQAGIGLHQEGRIVATLP